MNYNSTKAQGRAPRSEQKEFLQIGLFLTNKIMKCEHEKVIICSLISAWSLYSTKKVGKTPSDYTIGLLFRIYHRKFLGVLVFAKYTIILRCLLK